MTLIKLDSGDYINTEAVEVIEGGDNPYIELRSNNSFDITPADRDRIVKAMGGKHTPNKTALGEVYGALEMVNQGLKVGARYSDIDGILQVLKLGIDGEEDA